MAFGTQVYVIVLPCVVEVSILVFLEWPLGPALPPMMWCRRQGFQSLFFWNGLWDVLMMAF